MQSKNINLLSDFTAYCEAHPEMRFWQALRNWSGYHVVAVSNNSVFDREKEFIDTFAFEGKDS